MSDMVGYARVSTGDQDVAGQELRLMQAGAIKVFTDVRSGRTMDRPGLIALLDYTRRGDSLAVVRLDRLGRSLTELLATVAMLKERGIALVSLEERIDTGSVAEIPARWRFGERGRARLTAVIVSSRWPFGLAEHQVRLPLTADLVVYPRPLPASAKPLSWSGIGAEEEAQAEFEIQSLFDDIGGAAQEE